MNSSSSCSKKRQFLQVLFLLLSCEYYDLIIGFFWFVHIVSHWTQTNLSVWSFHKMKDLVYTPQLIFRILGDGSNQYEGDNLVSGKNFTCIHQLLPQSHGSHSTIVILWNATKPLSLSPLKSFTFTSRCLESFEIIKIVHVRLEI